MIDVFKLAKFTPTDKTLRIVMEIAAAIERYKIAMEGPKGVRLRKLNRVKTIRGTTAIEGNTLTEEDVTAIIEGKRIIGPKREIEEVKGAFAAYSKIEEYEPCKASSLLKAHGLMVRGLVEHPGKWRDCNVGVFNARGEAMHYAPPWDHVPLLMKDLFAWLKRSKDAPLVQSCIFHFIFETIHPFADGNGRMGRLWQSVILGRWNKMFHSLPIENMVYCHQKRYYQMLHAAQKTSDATRFVDFMLDMILRTLKTKGESGKKKVVRKGGKKTDERLVDILRANPRITFAGMVEALGVSRSAIQKHIAHLKAAERIRRVGPDKGGYWEVI